MLERDKSLTRNARLFMSDLHKLLDSRDKPISSFFINSLRKKWDQWGEAADSLIEDMGWRKVSINGADMFEKIPPSERVLPEYKPHVPYKSPELVIVPVVPRARRYGMSTNSDGQTTNLIDDGRYDGDDD